MEAAEVDGVHIVKLRGVLETSEAIPLETLVKTWLTAAAGIHILDCSGLMEVKQSAYRHLVFFNQSLKAHSKHLYVMNMAPTISSQLKADGLGSLVVMVASIEEAKKRASPNRATLDVDFINPFIVATKNVMEMQMSLALTPGKIYLRKPSERIPMEIAGILSLSCADFKGTISVCFRAETFLKLYELMVGEAHEAITTEMQDAAGEILNMIFGQAKTVLNDKKGYNLEKAIPTVMCGEKLRLHHQSRAPAIIVPFDSSAGAFHLEIVIDR